VKVEDYREMLPVSRIGVSLDFPRIQRATNQELYPSGLIVSYRGLGSRPAALEYSLNILFDNYG
jgi:hypothetical protein